MTESSLYKELAESVGPMAHLPNNGASYHTGEQIITHLNRVLGPGYWSFHILDQGQEEDSDEWWIFAQITAIIDGQTVVKQDYGSQAMKRARVTGKFISKGEDRKAAATDALKRCARLLGVGLDAWASEKAPSWRPEQTDPEERAEVQAAQQAQKRSSSRPLPNGNSGTKPTASSGPGDSSTVPISVFLCEVCGETLTETKFKSGDVWSASQLAVLGRRKHAKTLCLTHYRGAANANKRAEEVAF